MLEQDIVKFILNGRKIRYPEIKMCTMKLLPPSENNALTKKKRKKEKKKTKP